ncbi:hypothetical protein LINPERPRIM_LOCUS29250 [Linum perenne]
MSVDRTRDLQIFSLTLSQLSYPRLMGWQDLLCSRKKHQNQDGKMHQNQDGKIDIFYEKDLST